MNIKNRINNNKSIFSDLIQQGDLCCREKKYNDGLAFYQIAANIAWKSHCGFFENLSLENRLIDVSRSIFHPPHKKEHSKSNKVLHILNQVYPIGGHTRVVWNWISRDKNHQHSVLLLDQDCLPIPDTLIKAVFNSGGEIIKLNTIELVEKSREILNISINYSKIILHIHPYDVSVITALASNNYSSVVFFNHADHVFWMGSSISNLIACIRAGAISFCSNLRGIPKKSCSILPIPLDKVDVKESENDLSLIKNDRVVLLSIASSYKFTPYKSIDFCKILLPVLQNNNIVLIVVGAKLSDEYWKHYSMILKDKLVLVPPTPDIDQYYTIADIYIDSLPFGSLTSLLGAAQRGIPCLSWEESIFTCGEVVSSVEGLSAKCVDEFQRNLHCLIYQKEERILKGKKLQVEVSCYNLMPNWTYFLEKIYHLSEHNSKITPNYINKNNICEEDVFLMHFHSSTISSVLFEWMHVKNLSIEAKLWLFFHFYKVFVSSPFVAIKSMIPLYFKIRIKRTKELMRKESISANSKQ